MRPIAFLITLAIAISCSSDDKPRDARPAQDKGADGTVASETISGDPCSKVQQCAQACEATQYAECVAACRDTASEEALVLFRAYEKCARDSMDGECEDQCAGGAASKACGDCALAACLSKWNDCLEDV